MSDEKRCDGSGFIETPLPNPVNPKAGVYRKCPGCPACQPTDDREDASASEGDTE